MNDSVKAVFFDAVGTLIHPQPSAAEVYAEVGQRFGSKRTPREIAERFRSAFQAEEDADARAGWTASDERERRRWQTIVARVLDDVAEPLGCFRALYDHFAQPHAWRLDPLTERVLDMLTNRGYRLGLASNYDHRLRMLISVIEPLGKLPHVIISAEIGWRKPSREFFAAMCRAVDLPAAAVLYVGDDRVNDHAGARNAGLQAILLDPAGKQAALGGSRIGSLEDIEGLV